MPAATDIFSARVELRMTPAEKLTFSKHADAEKIGLSEWIRRTLNAATSAEGRDTPKRTASGRTK